MDAINPAEVALEIARLAALAPVDYERERIAAAKALGMRVSALDREIAVLHPRSERTPGHAVTLREVTPWETPVSAAELLNEIAKAVRCHLVINQAAADAIALWVLHTWVYERFQHTPRLTISSPTKRCGKSTLLEVLDALSRRPLRADNISTAGFFRTVEAWAPCTLFLDEADTFLRDNNELRGVLNSGFDCAGYVVRVVEIDRVLTPTKFPTFAPLAIAAIGKLPDTLEDRAVPILLQRKATGESSTKLRAPGARKHLATLARMVARWAADEGPDLNTNPTLPDAMGDREGDISVPLIAIAENAGNDWVARGPAALIKLFSQRTKDETAVETATMLLADIRAMCAKTGAANAARAIPSAILCARLAKMEHRPWPEWRNGKPITPPQLAAALRPFGIRPGTVRKGNSTAKGYKLADFYDAWARYLPSIALDAPSQAVTPSQC